MSYQWYYFKDGQKFGPVESDTLSQLITDHQVGPDDLVWREGFPQWLGAREVNELTGTIPLAGSSINYFVPTKIAYASIFYRFAAAFVDTMIFYVFLLMLSLLKENLYALGLRQNSDAWFYMSLLIMLFQVLYLWLYYAIMESSPWQATLGKRLVGIQVTGLNGERITFWRATVRVFAEMLTIILFFVGYLIQPFTPRRQALHDLISGTLVLHDTIKSDWPPISSISAPIRPPF